MADAEQILLSDRLHPRILLHLEHRLVAVKLQVGDLWRYDCQSIVLNMQFAQAAQLADFTWELQQVVVAQSKLK